MSTSQEHEFGGTDDRYESSTWILTDVTKWVRTRALALVHRNLLTSIWLLQPSPVHPSVQEMGPHEEQEEFSV
jgi:hypothetical protein